MLTPNGMCLAFTAGDAFTPRPLAELSLSDAHAILDVRFWGAVAVIKHAALRIRPGGSIGLTTGTVGRRPVPGAALAAAGAAEGLVRGLAVELAPVRLNAVRAGAFRTPLWDGVPESRREALFARLAQGTLTGTIGEPEQIAAAHIYLMQKAYVTGTVHTVDGGLLLTRETAHRAAPASAELQPAYGRLPFVAGGSLTLKGATNHQLSQQVDP